MLIGSNTHCGGVWEYWMLLGFCTNIYFGPFMTQIFQSRDLGTVFKMTSGWSRLMAPALPSVSSIACHHLPRWSHISFYHCFDNFSTSILSHWLPPRIKSLYGCELLGRELRKRLYGLPYNKGCFLNIPMSTLA